MKAIAAGPRVVLALALFVVSLAGDAGAAETDATLRAMDAELARLEQEERELAVEVQDEDQRYSTFDIQQMEDELGGLRDHIQDVKEARKEYLVVRTRLDDFDAEERRLLAEMAGEKDRPYEEIVEELEQVQSEQRMYRRSHGIDLPVRDQLRFRDLQRSRARLDPRKQKDQIQWIDARLEELRAKSRFYDIARKSSLPAAEVQKILSEREKIDKDRDWLRHRIDVGSEGRTKKILTGAAALIGGTVAIVAGIALLPAPAIGLPLIYGGGAFAFGGAMGLTFAAKSIFETRDLAKQVEALDAQVLGLERSLQGANVARDARTLGGTSTPVTHGRSGAAGAGIRR